MTGFSQIPLDALPGQPGFIQVLNDRLRRLSLPETAEAQQAAVITTTHAMRIAGRPKASDDPGSFLVESDRTVAYASTPWGEAGRQWVYVAGLMVDKWAKRPTDLGQFDGGFEFYASDYTHLYRWDGKAWAVISGEMRGTLASLPATLTKADTGFAFAATDYARRFRWNGTVWERAAGELPTLTICNFMVAPATGWKLCDGSAATYTTDAAGTASTPLPNLINGYVKGGGAYTGVVNGAQATMGTTSTDKAVTGITVADHSQATTFASTGSATADTTKGHAITEPNSGAGHSHTISSLNFGSLDVKNVVLMPYAKL